ncbi:DUF3800 domain-containing protein [Alphaproteobacteria bacterium KMM 3653]|uniref:DUF3800 domain-containing protein n=1 Tax=Harenicola maris TaxID=2841044 RepID=A0AAP2CQQ3_9RHOB|nr:DUF3800 domain-containing protein [Harenicola maris]
MRPQPKPYEYVLYIDEAGDDGLTRVRPIDETGASEWLLVSGVLIRARNEDSVDDWVTNIRKDINATQSPALHFRKLSPRKKLRTCELLAEQKAVYFVVCSNKKNMRGWENERAAKKRGKQWFYNWCVRCLLERTTQLCYEDGIKRGVKPNYLKIVFSERGSHSYGQTKAYLELLKAQAASKTTYLRKWEIKHEVLRYNLINYVPHTEDSGLQLADVIASAFYQACDTLDVKNDPNPAKLLAQRMARRNGICADYGVILQPTPPNKGNLNEVQKEIFEFFGYSFQ